MSDLSSQMVSASPRPFQGSNVEKTTWLPTLWKIIFQKNKMADIVDPLDKISNYKDSQETRDRGAQLKLLQQSATLYVGNLSFYSTEEQIYQLFSKCTNPEDGGGIKRIIMGLDRNSRYETLGPEPLRA
jgi:hypothetical protein